MSDLRDLIAQVLHTRFGPSLGAAQGGWDDEPAATKDMYREDADVLIEALNLRTDQVGTLTRYVTEWIDHD